MTRTDRFIQTFYRIWFFNRIEYLSFAVYRILYRIQDLLSDLGFFPGLNLLKPTRADFSYHFQSSRFQCKSIISFYSKLRKLQYFRQPYQHTRISHDVKVFQSRSEVPLNLDRFCKFLALLLILDLLVRIVSFSFLGRELGFHWAINDF